MSARRPTVLLALSTASCAAIANAQIPTPPGAHEFELAQIIRQAGYDCRAVDSISISRNPDPAFATLLPEVATCSNGKKFLIVRSGRGGVNARPVVRPLPGAV
jgi:hypothetical protein